MLFPQVRSVERHESFEDAAAACHARPGTRYYQFKPPVRGKGKHQRPTRALDSHQCRSGCAIHDKNVAATVRRDRKQAVGERIMIRGEGRIAVATVAIFVCLGGISAALHGLLFDKAAVTNYGVLAVFIAAATFVVLLTPMPGDDP
jgi:hypothetical protein